MPLLLSAESPAVCIGALIAVGILIIILFLKNRMKSSHSSPTSYVKATTVEADRIARPSRQAPQRARNPFHSPAEELFWNYIQEVISPDDLSLIIRQYSVGRYKIDFAIPSQMIAIEINGYDYHSSKEQLTHDARRTRYLIKAGWRVVPFTGSEVYRRTSRCVRYVADLAGLRWG